jgi:hypothetical protein
MRKAVAVLLGFVLLGGLGKARADHLLVTFSGEVNYVNDPTGGSSTQGIRSGSAFVATVTYDANASPLATGNFGPPGDSFATYPILSSSLRVGGQDFGPLGAATLTVANLHNPYDGFDELSIGGPLDPARYASGSKFVIGLTDFSGTAFPSLSLPTGLDSARFDLNHGLTDGYFEVNLKPAGAEQVGNARVSGLVNSFDSVSVLAAQTPEPGTLALLVSGGVGVLGMARRRRACSGT